ncbi:MAG: hypothetical protein C5B49_02225 [Bdellovibrio sp.]|nr:MAG: hypothetical protein C5B49_02225 [Bdellovibrio sp.]
MMGKAIALVLSIYCNYYYLSSAQAEEKITPVAASPPTLGVESVGGGKNRDEVYERLPQEQIFGAEIQYFRMRGGPGRNMPRSHVLELWGKALDAAKDAGMNMVSFYIPWDFHEYAEGQFDFDGTADDDGDGQPDYPARDVKTFIKMVAERGFKHIMVRPGPYINAEWGHLGFGAIPLWFDAKYKNSHMRNADGLPTKLVDYHNPDLLRHTKIWFKAVYDQVMASHMDLIHFVQVDNETNYLWQSIYNHDYGVPAMARYRNFLRQIYGELSAVNSHHQRQWKDWGEIQAPRQAGLNFNEDQDWYRFHDDEIHRYLRIVRGFWEGLGVKEPQVLFTLAESYNVSEKGLLPNYRLRNDPQVGLLTVNLYPKTSESDNQAFLNNPFKADHDVMAQETASEQYLGRGHHWVMGPETQAGWWKGTDISPAARQQTYLTVLGHGMKAMLVYYFNEGDNFDAEWPRQHIQPGYEMIKSRPEYQNLAMDQLPKLFWTELQKLTDQSLFEHNFYFGYNVKDEMIRAPEDAWKLYFDAPLDRDGNRRPHFEVLQSIGQKLIKPHGDWLRHSVSLNDSVCLLKDVREHGPSKVKGIDSDKLNAEWAGGLVGYALNTGINMKIIHWGIQSVDEMAGCRILFHQDNGNTAPDLAQALNKMARAGMVVVNLLGDSLAQKVGLPVTGREVSGKSNVYVTTLQAASGAAVSTPIPNSDFTVPGSPVFNYQWPEKAKRCLPVLQSPGRDPSVARLVTGYRCQLGRGLFYQVGVLFYDFYNGNDYSDREDAAPRAEFLRSLLRQEKIVPQLQVAGSHQRIVAFGRQGANDPRLWITVKSGERTPTDFRLKVEQVDPKKKYVVSDLLREQEQVVSGAELQTKGFAGSLEGLGSTVYFLSPAGE